jgi:hypothetical protein
VQRVVIQGDPFDIDSDGNTTEPIPCFQYWWDRRIAALREDLDLPSIPPELDRFFTALNTFRDQAQEHVEETLARREVEGQGPYGWENDGPVVDLARKLENPAEREDDSTNHRAYPVSFWEPWPNADQIQTWLDSPCKDCDPPAGWDEVDAGILQLQEISDVAEGFRDPEGNPLTTWEIWAPWFYNLESDADYWDTLGELVNGDTQGAKGIKGWQAELDAIRQSLPRCRCVRRDFFGREQRVPCTTRGALAENSPCEFARRRRGAATMDSDVTTDEFQMAEDALNALINDIEAFRQAAQTLATNLPASVDGPNPGIYRWQDSRGEQFVSVAVGPFRMPRIEKRKSGSFLRRKVCLRLEDYSDTGRFAWVEVSRSDPTHPVAKGLWTWNPIGVVSKRSRASYNGVLHQVGIAGVNR